MNGKRETLLMELLLELYCYRNSYMYNESHPPLRSIIYIYTGQAQLAYITRARERCTHISNTYTPTTLVLTLGPAECVPLRAVLVALAAAGTGWVLRRAVTHAAATAAEIDRKSEGILIFHLVD